LKRRNVCGRRKATKKKSRHKEAEEGDGHGEEVQVDDGDGDEIQVCCVCFGACERQRIEAYHTNCDIHIG
jgi:hypothetical protein